MNTQTPETSIPGEAFPPFISESARRAAVRLAFGDVLVVYDDALNLAAVRAKRGDKYLWTMYWPMPGREEFFDWLNATTVNVVQSYGKS